MLTAHTVLLFRQTTYDVHTDKPGGIAVTARLLEFCSSSIDGNNASNDSCVISRIYDQSPMGNHLGIEHGAPNLVPPRNAQDRGVNFTDVRSRATLNGKRVYAAFFAGAQTERRDFIGQGYSNRTARGTARGDEPQVFLFLLFCV